MPDTVLITEVALRDGLQIEPVTVPTAEKIAFGRMLVAAGFRHLEVGAFVSPAKVPAMADSADIIGGLTDLDAVLHALVFNVRGAERAVSAGARSVRFVVSASDGHSQANTGVTREAALQRLAEAAAYLRDHDIAVEATIATAFVCPLDGDTSVSILVGLAERLAALDIGVLHLADTIGAATPGDVRRGVTAVQAAVPEIPLGLHLHNTYGMASACVWEALSLGVRRFDAATGGLGGCPFAPGAAGNIAADDLVHLMHREGITTGIDPGALTAAREQLAKMVGHGLDSSLAVAGKSPSSIRFPG
ncbi:hydroxymethylglutaryl-CoA lyase [Mycolicibacterium thermoresistibile]